MSDLSPTQTLMSHREFRLLASGQLLSALGDGAALVAISFALMHATGSISALGWVLGARYSCLGALLLYSGVLADRMPRRPLLIGSDLSRFTAQAALALLLVTGHAGLVACIALQAAYGAAEAFSTPAFRGLVPQIVPPELFRQANVVGEITLNTSRVIGPALGGLLVMVAGASGAIAFDAATFLLSALLVAQMRPPGTPRGSSSTWPNWAATRTDFAQGWAAVRERRWLWTSILTFTVYGAMTVPATWVLGPAASWRGLGGVAGWSALTSAFGAGALVGSLVMLQIQMRRPALILMAALTLAALRPVTFVSGWNLPTIAAYSFIAGAAIATAGVVWFTLLQSHLPSSHMSRVGAIDDFGTYLLTPLGYFFAAPFATVLGLTPALILLTIVPVAACLTTMTIPDIRRLDWG